MRSPQIRSTFLDFFTSRDHRLVPSSSLIPNDPTLLLANAGMNQFKPYFLGEMTPKFPRATSVQKCARTVDIENVGRTSRHATFFEMLGSFSFGDYFKAEAIAFAYELLTEHYNLDLDRLWVTVFLDDDEAAQLWRGMGVPAERIQRLGREDNYWSMGAPGPCGPASEVCYDRGPAFGREGGPAVDGERYQEIWNLVFMQNLRGEGAGKGEFEILGELPSKNIDTGLGLDRLAAIVQDAENVCRTDLLAPTLDAVQELAGRDYPGDAKSKVSFQVVTEHARSVAFLIADGVLPSNEGRGYVLRRLLRRAVRHARLLGIEDFALPAATESVIDNLSEAWPELAAHRSLIGQVVTHEEETFRRTLRHGSRLLDSAVLDAKSTGAQALPGHVAFELHDTYGFPVELTIEAAAEAGLAVDEDRFALLMDEQRHRAKTARARLGEDHRRIEAYRELSARHGRTHFVGYDSITAEGHVLGLLADGEELPAAGEGRVVELILDRSPFYAEAGGQVGDTGQVRTRGGAVLEVTDTRPGLEGFHVHTARVLTGEIHAGELVESHVAADRRAAIARSHSVTHVLHALLRRALGEHAKQQGSLVAAGRLRFDFAHFSAVDPDQLAVVEASVNQHLLADPEVRVWQASRTEAEEAGATALFGEKYGEVVRIVDIGEVSRELCGGTHVGHGSQAGPVRILGESSIGSNLRRIEALTGLDALRWYDHERRLLAELVALLKTRPDDAPAQLRKRLEALATAQHELDRLRREHLDQLGQRLAAQVEPLGAGWITVAEVEDITPDELRAVAVGVLACIQRRPAVTVLGLRHEGKAILVAAVTADLAESAVEARTILANAAKTVGGGAGGRGAVGNAGGHAGHKLPEALAVARSDAERVFEVTA